MDSESATLHQIPKRGIPLCPSASADSEQCLPASVCSKIKTSFYFTYDTQVLPFFILSLVDPFAVIRLQILNSISQKVEESEDGVRVVCMCSVGLG